MTITPLVRRPFAASTRNVLAGALIALGTFAASGATEALQPLTESSSPPATPVIVAGDMAPEHLQETVTLMVELKDKPAARVFADSLRNAAGGNLTNQSRAVREAATRAAVAEAKGQSAKIEAAQQQIVHKVAAMSTTGKINFRTKNAYNGISIQARRDQIAALAQLPGVKAVHVQNPKFQTAATDVDFLGARSAWTYPGLGLHGEGVKIAIIDSGLDYVHTDFGGPGTTAAYSAVTDTGYPNAYFPSAKVPGGYDFAGDAYTGSNLPHADANPMDSSNGHGTACASLIGGLGVNGDGSSYAGAYDNLTDIASMKISPGFAPKASLYPVRVFGTAGSTNLVTEAIDWAIDPNGDSDFSDHMDVISMSLGANSGQADDPDDVAASNASAAGIIVASAAGNAGDSYYIVSSPSVANGTLSVAATFNNTGGFFYDSSVTPNSPAALVPGNYKSLFGSPNAPVAVGGLTADVVYALPPDGVLSGTTPVVALTNAAAMPGKICMIDRGGIGFADKVKLCQNAGAAAAMLVQSAAGSGTPFPIVASLTGPPTSTIPAVMIGLNEGNLIKAQLDPGTRSGVNVSINRDNGFVNAASTAADTMPTYSARGPRLVDSALKPDLSAPAEVVGVARTLTGNQVSSFNGTSSATPHVAGVMALLRQMHPTWTVEELMALAMNTATHDLFVGPATGAGARYGTGRVGAGRIDVDKASKASVVAYNKTNRGLVSVSFGIVEVPVAGSKSLSKDIELKNNGASDVTYNVSYADATPLNGASFTVGTGSAVTVTAGGTATVPVQFNATGNLLKHAREASVVASLPSARHWLSEKTGYAVLTPTSGTEPVLRVALYAAPKPVSNMHAGPLVATATPGVYTTTLSGTRILTGGTFPTDIISLVKPFELQYLSSQIGSATPPTSANTFKYVGVTSDYIERGASPANTVLTFLLEGFGDASMPSYPSSDKEIYISLNNGASYQYAIYLSSVANGTASSNTYVPVVVNLATSAGLQRFFTNGFSPASFDTNAYNNSLVTVPVKATDIGMAGAGQPTKFKYNVFSFDRQTGAQVDQTGLLTYDMAHPGLEVQNGLTDPGDFQDTPSAMAVTLNATNFVANGSKGLAVAHRHNGDGDRVDVQQIAVTATTTTVDNLAGQYSDHVTLKATVSPATSAFGSISGNVAFTVNGVAAGSAPVDSTTGVATLDYTILLGAGSYTIGASFGTTNPNFVSSTGSGTLTVSRENALVALDAGNPQSVKVSAPGGNADPITLAATITETADGSLGNICLAAPVSVAMVPVGPGSTINATAGQVSCDGTTLQVSATFNNVPVNVYDVTFSIGGNYYTGSAETVLAVYDPSLGNVTGGGSVIHNGVKANFAVNLKYLKNGGAQGSVLYIEHRPTGDLVVKGTAMKSLSIVGNTAIALTKNAIANGTGGYNLRMVAIDNGDPGKTDKIGVTLYDTTNAADPTIDYSAAPITISGGNISVPHVN